MKKKKCALGLVALLAATAGLASCDWPTKTNNGIILTYTDATGARVGYTAEELFGTYRQSSGSLSTEFDKVYEVLVRKYYDEVKTSVKKDLEVTANEDVIKDKQNATENANNNGTTFEEELEKILKSQGCDDVDELYQHHLYELEKERFQSDMYQTYGTQSSKVNGLETMKNGFYTKEDGTKVEAFPASSEWGAGNEGWLKEQIPYHIRHVLVKLSAGTAGNFTQDKIGESTAVDAGGETTKLANVVLSLAGASVGDDGKIGSTNTRLTFGEIAQQYSDDGSASAYGEYGIMSKTMAADLVHEFKLGTYVFDTLYNNRTQESAYGKANAYRLAPGLKSDATATADNLGSIADQNQTIKVSGVDKPVYEYFKDIGVGQIPFGAAVALLQNAKVVKDANGNVVNEDNDTFFPRNVIYNKYFNKHNVCVVTPNAIASNVGSSYNSAATDTAAATAYAGLTVTAGNVTGDLSGVGAEGVYSSQYGALPGFQKDTTNVLPQFANNVLTDNAGNIILAVRAGASSYQGIHFIVVQRSGLSEYGLKEVGGQIVEATEEGSEASSTSLSSYYTTYTPSQNNYPKAGTEVRNTYVNYNVQQTANFNERANKIAEEIKGYNSNLSTYWFQYLVENQNVEFTADANDIKEDIMTFCQTKRQSTINANNQIWEDNWKEYAEQIAAQEEARQRGFATGTGSLISEVCAIGYGKPNKSGDKLWEKGGACYYATK
ncbi:MAG: hypothetical protein MJ238_00035 [Bacilli bacterium]|nr:hypothetical protein [Bacilli bacterium]